MFHRFVHWLKKVISKLLGKINKFMKKIDLLFKSFAGFIFVQKKEHLYFTVFLEGRVQC